jgi:hypothetical protein
MLIAADLNAHGTCLSIALLPTQVELKIQGMPCDMDFKRTKHVYDSGRLVVNETYRFSVHFPEMAMLLILLKDMDVGTQDPVHGYASLPVSTISPGSYQIRLAKPYVMGARPELPGMWVKLNIAWEDDGAAAAPGAEVGKDVRLQMTGEAQPPCGKSVGGGEAVQGVPVKADVAAPVGMVAA